MPPQRTTPPGPSPPDPTRVRPARARALCAWQPYGVGPGARTPWCYQPSRTNGARCICSCNAGKTVVASVPEWSNGVMSDNSIWEALQTARDKAKEREDEEKQRVEDADNHEQQRAASSRVAARQAVRETLDDILAEREG
ncbi:Uncharacterised protein [Kocuria rhizophila]|nr:Uncharacterised protein [Kocuria rhizophila]